MFEKNHIMHGYNVAGVGPSASYGQLVAQSVVDVEFQLSDVGQTSAAPPQGRKTAANETLRLHCHTVAVPFKIDRALAVRRKQKIAVVLPLGTHYADSIAAVVPQSAIVKKSPFGVISNLQCAHLLNDFGKSRK
jgi:hypothetical protein